MGLRGRPKGSKGKRKLRQQYRSLTKAVVDCRTMLDDLGSDIVSAEVKVPTEWSASNFLDKALKKPYVKLRDVSKILNGRMSISVSEFEGCGAEAAGVSRAELLEEFDMDIEPDFLEADILARADADLSERKLDEEIFVPSDSPESDLEADEIFISPDSPESELETENVVSPDSPESELEAENVVFPDSPEEDEKSVQNPFSLINVLCRIPEKLEPGMFYLSSQEGNRLQLMRFNGVTFEPYDWSNMSSGDCTKKVEESTCAIKTYDSGVKYTYDLCAQVH